MNISVVGTGYVGLVTGSCFAELGLSVTCIDKDEEKINMLKSGHVPIYEPGLEEMIKRNQEQERLFFTTDIVQGVRDALVIFIAVNTPPLPDGSADLTYVEEVARSIAANMDGYKVIVTKSTVPVGTGERIRQIVTKHQKSPVPFDVASNPEFLREGSAIEDFMRPDRVVIGADSVQAIAILKDLYKPLYIIETPIVITSIESSEMIKYASNAFLATKISYINEIAELCERVGADVHHVAKGMGLDKRIGPDFLHSGPGYGGSCFPKDTLAILQIAEAHDLELDIVDSVVKVNARQRQRMIAKIQGAAGDLDGQTVGVWGLSFKPNTDDIRESPAIDIVKELQSRGAKIRAYDPQAMENTRGLLKNITYCRDPYEVAEGCDCLVLMTEWNQFRILDFERIRNSLNRPLLLDLRNAFEPEKMRKAGFEYVGVGR